MTREDLLELQYALISYLTDPRAFAGKADTSEWELLAGIDSSRMELLGLLAQRKRFDKVMKMLPRAFAYLQSDLNTLAQEFALRHPPRSANNYVNACQFYAYLRRLWRTSPPSPPFLPDLAYCELAMVSVGRNVMPVTHSVLGTSSPIPGPMMIRRRPGIHLRRCQYNIQPLLEHNRQIMVDIVRQPVCVVLSQPLNVPGVRVFQVDEELFEIIKSLHSWTTILPQKDSFDNEQTVNFFRNLEQIGILEIRLCESA